MDFIALWCFFWSLLMKYVFCIFAGGWGPGYLVTSPCIIQQQIQFYSGTWISQGFGGVFGMLLMTWCVCILVWGALRVLRTFPPKSPKTNPICTGYMDFIRFWTRFRDFAYAMFLHFCRGGHGTSQMSPEKSKNTSNLN